MNRMREIRSCAQRCEWARRVERAVLPRHVQPGEGRGALFRGGVEPCHESLGVDNLSSSQEYSSLLTSHWFGSRVGAEYVLIVQEDALLCTGPMQGLRTVGEVSDAYDYAGAPWEPYDGWVRGKAWLNSVGGNGGSPRRRSQALACLDLAPWQPKQWEDAYFVERLQQLGHRVMPAGRARHFAVEREYGFEPRPCGVHKVYNYLPPEKLMLILTELERRYDAIAAAVARCCR